MENWDQNWLLKLLERGGTQFCTDHDDLIIALGGKLKSVPRCSTSLSPSLMMLSDCRGQWSAFEHSATVPDTRESHFSIISQWSSLFYPLFTRRHTIMGLKEGWIWVKASTVFPCIVSAETSFSYSQKWGNYSKEEIIQGRKLVFSCLVINQ